MCVRHVSLQGRFLPAMPPMTRPPRATLEHTDKIGSTSGRSVSERQGGRLVEIEMGKAPTSKGYCNPVSSAAEAWPLAASLDGFFFCTPSPLDLLLSLHLKLLHYRLKPILFKCFMEHISALHLINLNLLVRDSTPEHCCIEPGRPRVFHPRNQITELHAHPC